MMAMTPSLNASSRDLPKRRGLCQGELAHRRLV
jgi:hypothetical protein